MALFTHADFDPTSAPAWDRVKDDDKQRIVHSWQALEDAATALTADMPDDDPQASKTVDELRQATLRVFDAIVAENLNEPSA